MSDLEDQLRESIGIVAQNKKLEKQVKELEAQLQDIKDENANLRARLHSDFDLDADRPALIRRQAD